MTIRFSSLLFAIIALGICGAPSSEGAESEDELEKARADAELTFKENVAPFVEKYCKQCHSNRRSKGAINFEAALKLPGGTTSSQQWKKAVANVKAHDMPPFDEDDIPTDKEREQFAEWIGKLKYLSPKDPGAFVIRRLTKTEYGNTLQDLYGIAPAIVQPLPDEVFGEGYMNSLSPLQSEQFLGIANEVVERVLKSSDPTKFFGDTPASGTGLSPAAREVARSLARDAYRRPPSEEELDVLVRVFDLARANELAYRDSLGLLLKAILVSPQFLFITPTGPGDPEKSIVPIDHHQLASRLSYLLWATMPDEELADLADDSKLNDPEVLKAQVKRMLLDPRSRALFDGFGAQWLGIDQLAGKTFDPDMFPEMTPKMRSAMIDEARLFFESIVRENRSVVRFVDSDFTFLNGTLAPLYDLEKTITGEEMRRVKLSNKNRGGVLGMPGTLATTSFPNRTSPVLRGVWVLEQLLGERIPPPPANVPELEEQDAKDVANLTLRQRTELHQSDPTCANCHKVLDPIGFGLENFDAIGRWRIEDASGAPIDSAGEIPGGKSFTTPAELKAILAGRESDLARNLTEKLLAYALCRQLEGYDEIVVDQLMENIAKDGYRMQTLITEIVTSYPFTQRRIKD